MKEQTVRGVFLAENPADDAPVAEVLRALAREFGFEEPERLMSAELLADGRARLTVTTELGENLLACAVWQKRLAIRREG